MIMSTKGNVDLSAAEAKWDEIIDELLDNGVGTDVIVRDFKRRISLRIGERKKKSIRKQMEPNLRHLLSEYLVAIYGPQVEGDVTLGSYDKATSNLLNLLEVEAFDLAQSVSEEPLKPSAEKVIADFVKNL